MLFSQTTEYALRAVVYLGQSYKEKALRTSQEISEITKVPAPYLVKVLQSLTKAGIVNSQRGLGGGFSLAIPPSELTVLTVINAVDPLERITSCPLKLEAHGENLCPLHKELDGVIANAQSVLAAATIEVLLSTETTSIPLCNVLTLKPAGDKNCSFQ